MTKASPETIKKAVSEHYGAFAREKLEGTEATGCCGTSTKSTGEVCCTPDYSDALQELDPSLAEHTQGCGNPLAIAELKPGETVLDLGSGAGLDCFLSAKQVGPTGKVIGVDMTDDMLALAEKNKAKLLLSNVEFHKGHMEKLPVDSATVDTVISNCVINLSPDKGAVFAEAFRVLKPGGRFRVSDIVWLREPTAAEQNDLMSWSECVAGAQTADAFQQGLEAAGFTDVRIDKAPAADNQPWTSASILAHRP